MLYLRAVKRRCDVRSVYVVLWLTPALMAAWASGAAAKLGPSFNCAYARPPLAAMLCSDPELSLTDLRFGQAYYALLQSSDPQGKSQLEAEDRKFLADVQDKCRLPHSGTLTPQIWQARECVKGAYEGETAKWVARLTGAGLQEAVRPAEQHVELQLELQKLGFLRSIPVSGVYDESTRAAISAWQSARGRSVTGLLGDVDAQALDKEAGASQPRTSETATPTVGPASVSKLDESASPATGQSDEVALQDEGGTYGVPVRINGALTLNFTIDSGAADVLIPADVMLTLMRTGTLAATDFIGSKTYGLADGSKLPSMTFILRELRVGSHRLENVRASVGPVEGGLLLGQSFLSRFKSWTLDNDRHVLRVIERLPEGEQQATQPAVTGGQPSNAPVPPVAQASVDLPYLFEQERTNPVYKTVLASLLRGNSLPPWVSEYLSDDNGVQTPGRTVMVGAQTYELYKVCKPHDCFGNFLYILFNPGGQRAVALVTADNVKYRYFGSPSEPERNALLAATTSQQ